VTGNCQPDKTCGSVKTATPTHTPTPRRAGDPCTSADQCADDLFCSVDEFVCCTSPSCPDGQSCSVASNPGVCTTLPTPTRTPTPRLGDGQTCDPSNPDACESGSCINETCCDTDACFEPDRCDIFGFEGTCAPPLLEGDECEKNTDCEDPLLCSFNPDTNRFECSVPPEATPTLIPFTPPPTAENPIVNVSRSGGCAIGQGPDGSPVWVFCLLPLALWLRRRQVQRIQVRTDVRRRDE
jgi:hypothetical protein